MLQQKVLCLYNTRTRAPRDFAPADPSHVTFYTCGPTVYDDAHIGNFRSFLAADLLRRFVESPLCVVAARDGTPHLGPRRVTHVMNITDVGHMTDDAEGGEGGEDRMAVAGKRLAEAKKSGKLPPDAKLDPNNPYDIAAFYGGRFLEDARTLGLKVAIEQEKDPTLMPRATQSIPGMIAVIQKLVERGHAYAVGEPGKQTVYFNVPSFEPYGRLSGNSLDALSSGAGGRISESHQAQKKHPADFLLWKADPSHIMKWDSPWGAGYPGWHIECSAMAAARLVGNHPGLDTLVGALAHPTTKSALIDLHSGGEDNIFPHHESEIAQSSCAFCKNPEEGTLAHLWFHPRHLFVNGAKMSKSKGNFFTIRDLIAKGHEPAAIRLELIRTHYRSQANFTEQGLQDCARMIERWRRARLEIARRSMGVASDKPNWAKVVEALFAEAMCDDLNIAGAIGMINVNIHTYLHYPVDQSKVPAWSDDETEARLRRDRSDDEDSRPIDIFRAIGPVLGVFELVGRKSHQSEIALYTPGTEPSPEVEAKLIERREARAKKDFAASDRIRDELGAMGYAIKDVAGGRVEVRRA
jgi:cysteinyl-tRNA synthetase